MNINCYLNYYTNPITCYGLREKENLVDRDTSFIEIKEISFRFQPICVTCGLLTLSARPGG